MGIVAMALPMKKAAMKAAAMKKSGMGKAGAMKAMKARKAKKVSVIAKGKGAMARVFSGKKAKTQGGLSKENPEEQAWEGRVQEEVRAVEEEVRVERLEGLVRCREEGAQ